jgi:putative membrane protein
MASSCASGMFIGRVVKGFLAGVIGGLVGAWVMNKFQERSQANMPGAEGGEENATTKAAGAVSQAVLHRPLTKAEKPKAAVATHYATGAVAGALYGAAAEILPVVKAGMGIPFGAIVWLIADEVAVPSLGLAKSPTEYPLDTHADALAAHMVYGIATDVARRVAKAML